jgi:hypothetical protein
MRRDSDLRIAEKLEKMSWPLMGSNRPFPVINGA